ncbi:hypothetical protein I1A62_40515 [Rhodococcus sp. USK10]|uniref:hypothetical protein n=1 Tax=Rhodococcus sp. USK10 TaxID=2789739 RepID=UPI001C5CC706|nr:hypothetical protein [Rhodococcus sp. USK10]QYB03374.1 hypothetical protein I1A62_40515 [Rhodococcus sp. USK10]
MSVMRRTIATATVGIAAFGLAGTAAADPATPDVPGLAELRTQAVGPEEKTAVEALATSTVLRDVAGENTPFFYTAPTVGCGTLAPVTLTLASGTTGPTAEVKAHEISFQALSAYPGVVKSSGLNVAWINTSTGGSGILPLDGLTEDGYPALNKVVATGAGTVVASIFGTVDYTSATCYVLPTVGSFFVPEEGPLPAEAAQPAPAPAPPA